jgi:hypothetical protein
MNDKERLHRIWVTAEYLFIWWQYLPDEEKLLHLLRIVEDSRNSKQIEQLRDRLELREKIGLEKGRIGQP